MADPNFAPPKSTRTDIQIGLPVEDQRTGELRRTVYADSRVVLLRDEAGSTTLVTRDAFETQLGTRYRPRPDAETAAADIDGGQYDALRECLAEYERREGRKAAHKVDALQEALDLFPGHATDEGDGDAAREDTEGGESDDREVPLETVPGIGPETAGRLRVRGFVTEADFRAASDDELLAVSGLGPSTLDNLREFLD